MKTTLILLALLLTSCTHALNGFWITSTRSPQDFNKDSYECDYDARMLTKGVYHFWQIPSVKRQGRMIYQQCMEARGYEWHE